MISSSCTSAGCILQMGGSDQWGNIIMGADLGRRMEGAELFALTSPLLATSSGAKMEQDRRGRRVAQSDRLSPYDFWQYWRNSEDADVGRFLKISPICRSTKSPGSRP